MNMIIRAEELENIFSRYLPDANNYFVFSTDVVKNSWIDWCVLNPEKSGVSAVAMERFLAWDFFKSEFITEEQKDGNIKNCIPAILRKVFVQNIIQENAKSPFLKKLINPEFSKEASSFTNWIAKILPNLKQWYALRTKINTELDTEEQDYEILYKRYNDFLLKNNLYEPSWQEINFTTQDKKFILIFPEILEDFCDFEDILSKQENITLINLNTQDVQENGIPCYEYSDSRKELRRTILQIRKLNEQGIDYQRISLSVPDLETYTPYLERELTKYCIPYVIRSGIPLLSGGEANIFRKFIDCVNSDFSYDSVRAIVLDEYIPWKTEFENKREDLIRIGCEKRCICNFTEDSQKIDIWNIALKQDKHDYKELNFYNKLKNNILRICNAASFNGIIQAWEMFKIGFLDDSNFTTKANNIISRCIVHLQEIIQIEQDFFEQNNFTIQNPYEFFINELNEKTYTMQSDKLGLNIYPYKLSAAAKIDFQFVIDASQNNLEVQNKKLNFLSNDKRKILGLLDYDQKYNPSKAFITLYSKNTKKDLVTFSYAQDSFAGFAISHNLMNLVKDQNGEILKNPLSSLDKDDFILQEKNQFLTQKINNSLIITKAQKEQFAKWYKKNSHRFQKTAETQNPLSSDVIDKINYTLIENRNKHNPSLKKMVITQSDMDAFFTCPRAWLLSRVLGVQEESLESTLTKGFEMGNLNHKILELYMNDFIQNNKPLPVLDQNQQIPDFEDFLKNLDKIILNAIEEIQITYDYAPLVTVMLESQRVLIAATICAFLEEFLKTYGGYYVCGVEKSLSCSKGDYELFGYIDCLLSTEEEKNITSQYCIIDYKNSSYALPRAKDVIVKTENNLDVLDDFQMAMYVTLVKANNPKQIKTAGFYSINDSEKKNVVIGELYRTKRTEEDFEPTLTLFNRYTEEFYKLVTNKDFRVNNENFSLSSFDDCAECKYKTICRHSFTIANKDIEKGL